MQDKAIAWLNNLTEFDFSLENLPESISDASSRCYVYIKDNSQKDFVLMVSDNLEENERFIKIQNYLQPTLKVPTIFAINESRNLLLLDNLGNRTLLDFLLSKEAINELNLTSIYKLMLDQIIKMQVISSRTLNLPLYDKDAFGQELDLCNIWYLNQEQNSLGKDELFTECKNFILENINYSQKVFVHRDFHSNNIMFNSDKPPGILDFQDAVIGPVSYDVASLLKDCYFDLEGRHREVYDELVQYYYEQAVSHGIIKFSFEGFFKELDFIACQRHIKVLGVFSRLNFLYKKPNYLSHLPLVRQYLQRFIAKYQMLPESKKLRKLLSL